MEGPTDGPAAIAGRASLERPSAHCDRLVLSLVLCAECVLLVLCHWLLYLHDVPLLRVLNKFVERDCDKVDRVLELLERYSQRLQVAGEPLVDASNPSLAAYSRRLSSGLYGVQLCALLLAFLHTAGEARIEQHIRSAFYQRDRDVAELCDVLDEQQSRLLEEADDKASDGAVGDRRLKQTIVRLVQLVRRAEVDPAAEDKAVADR